MKLQINSLAALERLIGNDNEIEIDIRKNVVDAFAKKHLKAVANEMFEKGTTDAVKTVLISEGFFNEAGTNYYNKRLVLGHRMKELVAKSIDMRIAGKIRSMIDERMESPEIKQRVQKSVDNAVSYLEHDLRNNVLEGIVGREVSRRLTAVLENIGELNK